MKNCEKTKIIILLLLLLVFVAGSTKFTIIQAAGKEDTVTYRIDDSTEITYYPDRGPYGRIEYTKKHYTSNGGGIKYYTSKFVISHGVINENTNLENMGENSITLDVSDDGQSVNELEVDRDKMFYWSDSVPDRNGYITTTYSIDGSYFYELMGGKFGKLYIHHVFAVANGEDITSANPDDWHRDNGVINNKEYWRYSDLLKLWWNDTKKTHDSQTQCMNIPVPYERNVAFIINYYDDKTQNPVYSDKSFPAFYSDYENGTVNILNYEITPEINIGGRIYEVYKTKNMPINWKWVKVGSGIVNMGANPEDIIPDAYNRPYNDLLPAEGDEEAVGTDTGTAAGYEVKLKAARINGSVIPDGRLAENKIVTFDLSSVSGFTWEIILSIPVRLKKSTTDVSLHFFDGSTMQELGSPLSVMGEAAAGKVCEITKLSERLESSGLSNYEIDSGCGLEFTAAGEIPDIRNRLSVALLSKTGNGRLTGDTYFTEVLTGDSVSTAWIPVKRKQIAGKIPVYLRYVTNDGTTINDWGITGTVKSGEQFTITAEESTVFKGTEYSLAEESEYGSRTPKAVYSTADDNLLSLNYNALNSYCRLVRNDNNFVLTAPDKNLNAKAIKVFIPYVKDRQDSPVPTPGGNKSAYIEYEYIDSETGKSVYKSGNKRTARGASVSYDSIPKGYAADVNQSIYPPLAVYRTGVNEIPEDYRTADRDSTNIKLDFVRISTGTVVIPDADDDELAVKVFIPVKSMSTDTLVTVKYFNDDGNQIGMQSAGRSHQDENTEIGINELVEYNGKLYHTTHVECILYGNDRSVLVAGLKTPNEMRQMIGTDSRVIGEINKYEFKSSVPMAVNFRTSMAGDYHTVYVICSEVPPDSTRLNIHYIDGDTGRDIRSFTDIYYLNGTDESWEGIEGRLMWSLPLNNIEKEIKDSEGNVYTPVFFSEDPKVLRTTVHNGCSKGETVFKAFDVGTQCLTSIYYCQECGCIRRFVDEKTKEVIMIDDNDYKKHSYTTVEYLTEYKPVFAVKTKGVIKDILAFDPSYEKCSENALTYRSDVLLIGRKGDTAEGTSTFTPFPSRTTEVTGLTVYIPCVKSKSAVPVEVTYITTDTEGKQQEVITKTDGPDAETGKQYTYRGSTVIEKDGKLYTITGKGDFAVYGGNRYNRSKDDKSNTLGTPMTFDGENGWSSVGEIPDTEKVTVYITVDTLSFEEPEIPAPMTDVNIVYNDAKASAVVMAKKGTPFDVREAIPSTEYIYSRIEADAYIFAAGFKNITGSLSAEMTVTLPYTLVTTDDKGNTIHTEDGKSTVTVSVAKPYSYWTLDSASYYSAVTGEVTNNASAHAMSADFESSVPEFSFESFGGEENHVRFTDKLPGEIILDRAYVFGTETLAPKAPELTLTVAKSKVSQLLPDIVVRNDSVRFSSKTVLNGEWTENGSTEKPQKSRVSKPGTVSADSANVQITKTRSNKEYESHGYVKYVLVNGLGKNKKEISVPIEGINPVRVHTPVIAGLMLSCDNLKYVQAHETDPGRTQLVLGRSSGTDSKGLKNSSNDFEIIIENSGEHIPSPGYGSFLDTSAYIDRQELMFGFDVIKDSGSDGQENNDILIPSGTWTAVDTDTSYYVPEWVKEGIYTVTLKTYAVNASDTNNGEQRTANTDSSCYVAYDTSEVEITGKLYGLTITSVNSDFKDWKNVFVVDGRIKNAYPEEYGDGTLKSSGSFSKNLRYTFVSGLSNELGIPMKSRNSRFIFPVLNGSSPALPGAGLLKSGYVWNFRLNTVGSRTAADKSAVLIIPTFYWISEDGKERERVDLWYRDTVNGKKYNLIKVGDETDRLNQHTDYASSATSGIPPSEIADVDSMTGNNKRTTKNVSVYTYGEIGNPGYLKTFTGKEYEKQMTSYGFISPKSRTDAATYEQTWYFEYGLPDKWYACPAGFDLKNFTEKKGGVTFREDFWKKDGYLAVHFDIGVYDEKGLIMTYSNTPENLEKGMCDMWQTEAYQTVRTDSDGKVFNFAEGDVFVVGIGRNSNASQDYTADHLN